MVKHSYVVKEFTPSLLRSYIFLFPNSLDCLGNLTFFYRDYGLISGLPLGSCLDCTVGLSFHISTFVYGFVSMASVSAIAPIEVRRAIHNRP